MNATQIVLGASRRGRLGSALNPGAGPEVVRESGDIDVHIVTHERAGRRGHPRRRQGGLDPTRVGSGWAVAGLGLALLTGTLVASREAHGLPTVLMLYLLLTVAVALVGGWWPALATAVASGLLANYLFTPPLYTWNVDELENALAIVVLVLIALAVSAVVDLAARRTRQAARARAEADTLTVLAGSVIRGQDAVPALMEQLRETFGLRTVALFERSESDRWAPVASAGADPPADWSEATVVVPIRDGLTLAADGEQPGSQDLRVLTAVCLQADAMPERDRLRSAARAARNEQDRAAFRAALLAAVSHDLRTPLAAIKIGVSSLRSPDVDLAPDDQAELLATIESGADRLQSLIDNLLDMSRLDAGAVTPHRSELALEDVVARALTGVDPKAVVLDVPETLPIVQADGGLLERVLANLVENALCHAPGAPVLVQATATGTQVVVRVVDRGPGVSEKDKERMFRAFQRVGDSPNGHGVGLGLAVARGFSEAIGAGLDVEDTPGGGLTMVLSLPVVRS